MDLNQFASAPVIAAVVAALISQPVAAWLAVRGKREEARLRIATEARLRLLDRQIADVGELRKGIQKILMEIHRFATEASLKGGTEEANTMVRDCRNALRSAFLGSAYVPPDLMDDAEDVVHGLEDVINDICVWIHLDKTERYVRCEISNAKTRGIASSSRSLFGSWQRQLISEYDRLLDIPSNKTAIPKLASRTEITHVRLESAPVVEEKSPLQEGETESPVRRTQPRQRK